MIQYNTIHYNTWLLPDMLAPGSAWQLLYKYIAKLEYSRTSI